MDQFLRDPNRDTILYVHDVEEFLLDELVESINELSKQVGRPLKVLIVSDRRDKNLYSGKLPSNFERVIVNTRSVAALEKALLPHLDKLLCINCRAESYIPYFINIIPHVPYLQAPNTESLEWATDKIMMRRRLRNFNHRISPKYTIIKDFDKNSIQKIKKKVGFPLIVKPAGLAASVLVSVCYHEEELEDTIKKSLKKLKRVYEERKGRGVPALLVEEMMDGRMYSVDVYVNSRGTTYATPLVNVITGFMRGEEDFYGYMRRTPVTLKSHQQQKGIQVSKEAVEALGLRSTTAHVELMLTDDGWKIIEAGPRIGGFRHEMYKLSFGIDHMLNDLLIRLPMRPIISRRTKSHTVAMQFFAPEEGIIEDIKGLKTIKTLKSYYRYNIRTPKGKFARYARHGGVATVDLILSNKDRSDLQADIRRAEQAIKISVAKKVREVIPEIVTEVTHQTIQDK